MICDLEKHASGTIDAAVRAEGSMAQSSCDVNHGRRKNILFIIDQLCVPGGAERALLNTIRGLPRDRFNCQVATFRLNREVELFAHPPCPVHVFPLRRTYDLRACKLGWQLRDLIRKSRIDIVHTFHETSDLWGGLVAKASGCPVLVSSRRDMGFMRSLKHELGYRVLNCCFDKVLSVSEQVRQRCMQAESLSPSRVVTLYNGIDLAKVDATPAEASLRKTLGIEENAPLITAVGHLRRIKGIDVLLQAAHRVCREVPEAVFLVVGNPTEKDYCEELYGMVAQRGLGRNVRFLGPRDNVLSLLKASDVFCLPSRSEGFSNALIEAMACSLPCVATDVGGNGEAISNAKNGYLVPAEDHVRMAERILDLLRSPEQARNFGREARRTVEQRFSFDAMICRLVAIYGELTSAKLRRNGKLMQTHSCGEGIE